MFDRFSTHRHQLLLLGLVRFLVVITAVILMIINDKYWSYPLASAFEGWLFGYALTALVTLIRAAAARGVFIWEIGGQLLIDITFMSALFYYSGGAGNPFVSFLLFPLIVSAQTQSRGMILTHLLVALSLYGGLFLLPPPDVVDLHAAHLNHNGGPTAEDQFFSLHMLGMWVNFAITALLVATVVVMMSSRIRRQSEMISKQREDVLKREQLLSIATEAASVAHHMGTPLSTIAVIANDLRLEPALSAYEKDLTVLEQQVAVCKSALAELREKAQWQRLSSPSTDFFMPVISEIRHEFQLLRPQTDIRWNIAENAQPSKITHSPSLRLALLNLLNNAADAAKSRVIVEVYCHDQSVFIDIFDDGPGVENEMTGDILVPVKSSKHSSVGLGLYLSHASINQLGGQVALTAVRPEGTLTQVRLPLVV